MQHRPQQADGNRFNLERAELVSDRDNGLVVELMPISPDAKILSGISNVSERGI